MDERLDPSCVAARALDRTHRDQEDLLVAGSTGPLAAIVRTTAQKQVNDHLVSCARCRHFDPRCAECGFDPRRERHGWMCKRQTSRFADIFPWNWRAKLAPKIPAGAVWKHQTTRTPGGARVEPTRTPGGKGDAAARYDTASVRSEYSPPVAERAASSAPKPRAKPQPMKPNALALAYASLGLGPDASEEAVRAAYRTRAQQYHPDKVAHLAPEFRAVAETKMTEINGAYERIKRSWSVATK